MTKIAVIVTVFNRKLVTKASFESFFTAVDYLGGDYSFDVYMVDDGSTDGTSELISETFPSIKIIKGDGNLYWCKGMYLSWKTALESGISYDYFLWINDDAILFENALKVMFDSIDKIDNNGIVSGAFHDSNGKVSYGGSVGNLLFTKFSMLTPNGDIQDIKYSNGNLLLIPYKVYEKVGIIENRYQHGYGDNDYSIRCIQAGLKVVLSPCYVGTTNRHDDVDYDFLVEYSCKIPIKERFKRLYSIKKSFKDRYLFTKKDSGLLGAIFIAIKVYTIVTFPWLVSIKRKIFKQGEFNKK